jgi:hypothetical protein
MNRFAFFALAAVLVGCTGKSTQINTPRVDITDDDDHRTVNSVGRYEKCKEDLMQFLPEGRVASAVRQLAARDRAEVLQPDRECG